jgi:hypothetical protein
MKRKSFVLPCSLKKWIIPSPWHFFQKWLKHCFQSCTSIFCLVLFQKEKVVKDSPNIFSNVVTSGVAQSYGWKVDSSYRLKFGTIKKRSHLISPYCACTLENEFMVTMPGFFFQSSMAALTMTLAQTKPIKTMITQKNFSRCLGAVTQYTKP